MQLTKPGATIGASQLIRSVRPTVQGAAGLARIDMKGRRDSLRLANKESVMNQTCRACSGKRVLHSERVWARAFFGGPVVLAPRGLAETDVSGEVCVDCGHIEFKATDLAKLRTAYAAHELLDLKA